MRHSCKTGKAKEKPWEVSGNKKGPSEDTTGEFAKHISREHDKMADNRGRTGGESGSQKYNGNGRTSGRLGGIGTGVLSTSD